MPERKNDGIVFKHKTVTNFAFHLENKSDITATEFVFHYLIYSYAHLKRQLNQI